MKKAEVEMSATQSSIVHIQETDVREIEKVDEEEEANLIPRKRARELVQGNPDKSISSVPSVTENVLSDKLTISDKI